MIPDERPIAILVFATKFAVGHPDPVCDTPIEFVLTRDAFRTQYVTDAHFVAYETPIRRRVTIQSIGLIPIQLTLLVADVDAPHKVSGKPSDEWREAERVKIARVLRKHPGAFVYETRGGYRVVFRLAQPFQIRTKDDKTRWWAHYGAFRSHLAAEFSISIDPACKDFTRFYRLPRVLRDGERTELPSYGDPAVADALDFTTPELPKKFSRTARKHLENGINDVRAAPEGTRNKTLNRVAFSLGGMVPHELDYQVVYDSILHAILANGGDAEKDGAKIQSALEAGMKEPRLDINNVTPKPPPPPKPPSEIPPPEDTDVHRFARFTDVANAGRLVEFFGRDLRYVTSWDTWIAWDGKRWSTAVQSQAGYFAIMTAKRIMEEACDEMTAAADAMRALGGLPADDAVVSDDQAKAKRAYKTAGMAIEWAKKSHFRQRLDAMLSVARSDPQIAISHEDLDTDPWLFNADNGTINLRNGTLRHHVREDLITKISPIAYDPNANAPTWSKFLDVIAGGNRDFISYLSRAIGYSLTGETREHVLFFFHGDGANGKSTFLNTVHAMCGDYATVAPRSLLFQNRGEQHPTEYATLHGARFVTCSEIGEGQRFDESLVKDLTGGDPIKCRRMREDFWSYLPTHKLFIAGNHKPQVRGNDEGIWRRIRLVPWNVAIAREDRDKDLATKLRGELPGILAWAVAHCLEWQKNGLPTPKNVAVATEEYREESDTIGEFFNLRCAFNGEARVPCRTLREAYETFCRDRGDRYPLGARAFSAKIRIHAHALGIETRATTTRAPIPSGDGRSVIKVVNAWAGIRLLEDHEVEQLEQN